MGIIEFPLKLGIYQLELDRLEWLYLHVVDCGSKKRTDQDQGLQSPSDKQLSLVWENSLASTNRGTGGTAEKMRNGG